MPEISVITPVLPYKEKMIVQDKPTELDIYLLYSEKLTHLFQDHSFHQLAVGLHDSALK